MVTVAGEALLLKTLLFLSFHSSHHVRRATERQRSMILGAGIEAQVFHHSCKPWIVGLGPRKAGRETFRSTSCHTC